jgi:23S rRNA pseudouridine955/2504/2580 synthase
LVNRLDRNTKGIVIGAKNAESLKILNQKIKDREIDKFYLCQVMGKFPKQEGILEDYLTKNEKLKKVTVSKKPLNEKSVRIITQYKLLSYDKEKNTSLLEIKLITGKTHQIRAHLAFYGFPIVGDSKYGTKDDDFAHQDLTSCKVIFNFKSDAGILNYLNKKEFKINPK